MGGQITILRSHATKFGTGYTNNTNHKGVTMEGFTTTGGNTPFEKAAARRAKANLMLITHLAVKELVDQLDECTQMIDQWAETVRLHSEGKATAQEMEADLILATEALKDRKLFEQALVVITQTAADDLGLEA